MKMWIDRATGRLYANGSAGVIIGGGANQVFNSGGLTIEKHGNRCGAAIGASLDLAMVIRAIEANGKFVWSDELEKTGKI